MDQVINSVITTFTQSVDHQSNQPVPPPADPPPPMVPIWLIGLIIAVALAGVSIYLWSLRKSKQRIINYMLNEYVAKLLKDNESLILSSIESGSKNTLEA